jgi:hypothetical protein
LAYLTSRSTGRLGGVAVTLTGRVASKRHATNARFNPTHNTRQVETAVVTMHPPGKTFESDLQ